MNPEQIAVLGDMGIYLLSLPRLEDRSAELKLSSSHHILLMMADARLLTVDQISEFEEWAFQQGMVYLCSWESNCERVHDIADEIIVEKEIQAGRESPLIFTTWHHDEEIKDMVWYALHTANPDEFYMDTCKSLLIVVLNNPEWESQIRDLLKKPDYYPD
jgi:hypothetical protein